MITGIDVNETHDYVLEDDKGSEKPTVFVLKTLADDDRTGMFDDRMEGLELAERLNSERDRGDDADENEIVRIVAELRKKLTAICVAGIKCVKNIQLGKKVNESRDDVAEVMRALDLGVLSELAREVVNNNFLTRDDEKN